SSLLMLNFEFVGNIETLRSIRYIAANHVGTAVALFLSRRNSYWQKQSTFDQVQLLGKSRRLDPMRNAGKKLLAGEIFNEVGDSKKFVRLDDRLFDRGFSLDAAVLGHYGREIDSDSRRPVEEHVPAVALSYQVECFLPFNHLQAASALQL